MTLNWQPAEPEMDRGAEPASAEAEVANAVPPPGAVMTPAPPPTVEPPGRSGRIGTRLKIIGALVLGGIGGASILGPIVASAASPAPTTTAANPSTGADADHDGDHRGFGGPGGPGGFGLVEAVSDTSVVAKAIGIGEADLRTALARGQTIAAVAKARDVDVQVVIDALVADSQSEIAAALKAGTITQAQADALKANLVQHATDRVNGTFMGGHGPGGPGGTGGFGRDEAVSDTSVVAAAIGISEADLRTALAAGQTVAAVAKAHDVDVQKVIDALVADGESELAAAVKAGIITQAQADAEKAEVVQRATDQVNGTFGGPHF